MLSALYGVLVGITQQNPRTVLAYSSVSQMGLLAAALGMGLAEGDTGAALGVSFAAAHHVLAKGGLFLAIGVSAVGGPRLWPVMIPAAILALGLGGLPLTGGMLAKLALKAQFGEGVIGMLAALSAIVSTLLMIHFLRRLAQTMPSDRAPTGLIWPWLLVAFAAVAVPWVLYPTMQIGSLLAAVSPASLWAAAWPILIGGVPALGLCRWGKRLPYLPEGDVVVVGERAVRASIGWGAALERADGYLRQWPVASLLLLILVIILGAAMLTSG